MSRNEAQIGIGHVSLISQRYNLVDYTTPTYFVEYGHITSKPKPLDPFKNVVSPFDNFVWLCIVGTVALMGLVFALVHFTYTRTPILSEQLAPVTHVMDYVASPASLLVNQDGIPWFEALPRASAGSVLNLFWTGTSLVLTLAYISNLR